MRILYIFYLLGLICLAVFSWLFIDPNLIYLKILYSGIYTQRFLVSTIYFLLISLLFVLFWIMNNKEKNYPRVKKMSLIICAILLFSYPAIFSFDIFNYIATSKVTFLYHENPYIMMPIEFIGDPILLFMHAPNKIALYGPFWTLLTGIPFFLGFNNFLSTLITFKLLNILFFLATIRVIYLITKKSESVFYFALNPLVITEALISSHNDIVMMFFGLIGIWFLYKKRIFIGILFFILSILIKYSTIFLLPVIVYLVYSHMVKKKVNLEKVFFGCFILMFSIFALSFMRGEIYSWYFIWPLVFAGVISNNNTFKKILIALSYGLMLRYIPFMLTGNYFGSTPILRTILMIFPPTILGLYFVIKKYAK